MTWVSPPTDSLPPASPRRKNGLPPFFVWFGRALVALAFIAVLVTAGRSVVLWFHQAREALDYPYSLNYGEGPLLDQVVRLATGGDLYDGDLSTPPYTITNYPPLYLLAQTPFYGLYGPAFWYGRLISLVSAVVAALFLALTIRTAARDTLAGLAAGMMLFAVPYIFFWSALARIDTLALALSMIGLWLVVRFSGSSGAVMVAALFLAAAGYTRQTYLLAAPLAAFYWLWGARERYRALLLAVTFFSAVLILFAFLLVITRGGIFFHLVTANINLLDRAILDTYLNEYAQHLPLLLAAGGLVFFFGGLIRRREAQAKIWWLIAPFLAGGLITALTISKVGSDVNYLYEISAALCMAAGALVAAFRRLAPVRALILLLLAVQILLAGDLSERKYAPIISERISQRDQVARLADAIRSIDGEIIADEYMGMLVLLGRPITFQPFEMSQLALAEIWDQTPFLEGLIRGDYPYVLLYQPYRNPNLRFERWTPAMLRAINRYYRPGLQGAEATLYTHTGQ